jgi:hypothetical protein
MYYLPPSSDWHSTLIVESTQQVDNFSAIRNEVRWLFIIGQGNGHDSPIDSIRLF